MKGRRKEEDALSFRISNAALGLLNLTTTHSSTQEITFLEVLSSLSPAEISPIGGKSH